MAAGSLGVLLELSGVRSAVISALVLVFLLIAPAAAIGGWLGGFDPLARVVLAATSALAMITAVAMIMLAAGAWSPRAGLAIIAVLTAACAAARWWPALRRATHLPGPPAQWWPALRRVTHLAGPAAWLTHRIGRRPGPGHPATGRAGQPDRDGARAGHHPPPGAGDPGAAAAPPARGIPAPATLREPGAKPGASRPAR